MKLVTQTDVTAARLGEQKAVEVICQSGFDGIDYSMFDMDEDDCVLNTPAYLSHVRELKNIADSYGVTFEQSHAPFPSYRVNDNKYNDTIIDRIERAIEITALLGAKICVVHPVALRDGQREFNMNLYNGLLPKAKEWGVKIALENMWGTVNYGGVRRIVHNVCSSPEDFNSYLDALPEEYFTGCLDLGHCGLVGEDTADMIHKMGGKRIKALHIHDNNFVEDSHTIPYLMKMDWTSILKALGEIDYSGNFTYEADHFLIKFPDEMLPACNKFMCELGRYMMSEIEKYRVV